jgi:hypothetical protein
LADVTTPARPIVGALPPRFYLTVVPSAITWGLLCLAWLVHLLGLPAFDAAPEIGCYRTDALLPYIDCRGFPGASTAALLLTLARINLWGAYAVFLPVPMLIFVLLLIYPLFYFSIRWYGRQIGQLRHRMTLDVLIAERHPYPHEEAERLIRAGEARVFLERHGMKW